MAIKFYKVNDPYGCLSNFSRHVVVIDSIRWTTTEHFFQAQKFIGKDRYFEIAQAGTPRIAADLGRDRMIPLRFDWEKIKELVMKRALREKVRQHPNIRKILLETGDEELIEDSPVDYYWGCGADGSGKNRLGKLWMEVREEIKIEESNKIFIG